MAEAPKTVLLAGMPNIPQEVAANEAITPGHLVEFGASPNQAKLRKHATADGNAAPWFARESLTPDRSVATAPIDTPYAINETVRWFQCRAGDLVYALVPASAAAIIKGDELTSNGDGTVKKAGTLTVANPAAIVAVAAEDVNNSGGSTAVRIRVYAM